MQTNDHGGGQRHPGIRALRGVGDLGPVAVVTGASSGLGAAFAEALAAAGLDLVLVSRSGDALTASADRLAARHGTRARVLPLDLSEPGAAITLLDGTDDLDVGLLVSNAGAGRPAGFLDQPLTELRRRRRLNADTHVELAHGFGRRLVRRGGGGILLVSALGARHGIPWMAADASAKASVASLGTSLHHELAPSGVRVTVVEPGNVDTPVLDALAVDRDDLPMRPYPADRAVVDALAALLAGRPSVVPDARMRWLTRLAPGPALVRLNGRMMGTAARRLADREAAGT